MKFAGKPLDGFFSSTDDIRHHCPTILCRAGSMMSYGDGGVMIWGLLSVTIWEPAWRR